jgi:heat shock protein HslJ
MRSKYVKKQGIFAMIAAGAVLMVLAGMTAFGGESKRGSGDFTLEGAKWLLTEIKGEEIGEIETIPFINFDSEKKSAGGNTGCNVFGGNYEVLAGDKIRLFDTISTMRACIEDDRMEVERGFMSGLQNANRYEIKGKTLKLFRDKELLLEFRGEKK